VTTVCTCTGTALPPLARGFYSLLAIGRLDLNFDLARGQTFKLTWCNGRGLDIALPSLGSPAQDASNETVSADQTSAAFLLESIATPEDGREL
jgi:hypothetical protein